MTDDQLFSVRGKVIAVTGIFRVGPAHGACAGRSWRPVISISRTHAGESLCPSGGEVLEIMADVTRPEEIARAFDEGESRFGPISALFNNAGVAHMARALDTTRDMLEHIFEVNVAGAFFTAQEVARRMIAQGQGGSIINVTSILGERPQRCGCLFDVESLREPDDAGTGAGMGGA